MGVSATASASMSLMSSYSDTFPVLQRSKFWSDYMSALKGPLCADEPTYTTAQPSIWTQYRPVDITMYDLIYGSPPPPRHSPLSGPSTDLWISPCMTSYMGHHLHHGTALYLDPVQTCGYHHV